MDRNDLKAALKHCHECESCDSCAGAYPAGEEFQVFRETCEMLVWDQQVINGLLEYIEAVSAAASLIARGAEEASKRLLDLKRATAEAANAARIMGIGGEAAANAKPDT